MQFNPPNIEQAYTCTVSYAIHTVVHACGSEGSALQCIHYGLILQRWPEAQFYVVPDAGHFHTESGIQAKIMEAAKKYEQL